MVYRQNNILQHQWKSSIVFSLSLTGRIYVVFQLNQGLCPSQIEKKYCTNSSLQWQYRFKLSSTKLCPLCSLNDETFTHMLQCSSCSIKKYRSDLLTTLHLQLQRITTNPLLLCHLLCFLNQFTSDFLSKAPTSDNTPLSIAISKALSNQLQLGLQNMLCGLIDHNFLSHRRSIIVALELYQLKLVTDGVKHLYPKW